MSATTEVTSSEYLDVFTVQNSIPSHILLASKASMLQTREASSSLRKSFQHMLSDVVGSIPGAHFANGKSNEGSPASISPGSVTSVNVRK